MKAIHKDRRFADGGFYAEINNKRSEKFKTFNEAVIAGISIICQQDPRALALIEGKSLHQQIRALYGMPFYNEHYGEKS